MLRDSDGRAISLARRMLRCGRGALLVLLLLGVASFAGGKESPLHSETLVNRTAPEFSRRDLNGHLLDLAHFRGKVVLLNFWATWCAPCQAEMPVFSRWQTEYGPSGLQVIGISMDDGEAPVRKLAGQMNLAYPVAMGDARLGRLYGGVLGLPLTFLIDRRGVVRARFQGETDRHAIEKEVRALVDRR